MNRAVTFAPHPLLVLFPSLCPSIHSIRRKICSQVRLLRLAAPVLDEERFRVVAAGAQIPTISVQRAPLLVVGISLQRKDENNQSNKLGGHDGWESSSLANNYAAFPPFNTARKSPTSVFAFSSISKSFEIMTCLLVCIFECFELRLLLDFFVGHVAECLHKCWSLGKKKFSLTPTSMNHVYYMICTVQHKVSYFIKFYTLCSPKAVSFVLPIVLKIYSFLVQIFRLYNQNDEYSTWHMHVVLSVFFSKLF